MKTIKYSFFTLFIIFLSQDIATAQVDDVCVQFRLPNAFGLESLVTHDAIAAQNIRRATLIYQPKNGEKEPLRAFEFDEKGFITVTALVRVTASESRTETRYKRDSLGRIAHRTFQIIASDGSPSDGLYAMKADYFYNGNQTKIKHRNLEGAIAPDSLSYYQIIEKDEKGRMLRTEHHFNYGDSRDFEEAIVVAYNEDSLTSITQMINKRNERSEKWTKTTYNKAWQPIEEARYSEKSSKAYAVVRYEYDSSGKLKAVKSEQTKDAMTNCKDGGNYQLEYKYDTNGLLKRIIHTSKEGQLVFVCQYE